MRCKSFLGYLLRPLGVVLALLLYAGVGCKAAAAAEKPEVYVYPSLCTYQSSFNNLELDPATKHQTWKAVYDRLQQLEEDEQLPFHLKAMSPSQSHQIGEQLGAAEIVMIPAVMVSASMDTSSKGENQALYNSTVVNGLSLMLCVMEENYDIEGMGKDGSNSASYRIIGNVPLVKARTIGLAENSSGVDAAASIRTEPISQAEKLNTFRQLTRELMGEKISFNKVSKHIKNKDIAFDLDTYQVTGVTASSKKLKEFFSEKQLEDLGFLAGYYYTAAYQQRTGRVVLPPAVGNELNSKVLNAVSIMNLDSPNGGISISMSSPGHPIQLDISGAAYKAIPDGSWYTLLHRVWLSKSQSEGREKCELDRISKRKVWVPDGVQVEFDSRDVFTRLIMGLAQELGYQRL